MFARTLLLATAFLGATSISVSADAITDWNEKAVAFVTPRMPPPATQRVVAITHVAMFDAVNSIERRFRPYLVQLSATAGTSKEAAAVAAAGAVLAGLLPQLEGEIRGATAAYLVAIADDDRKLAGIRLGEAVAAKILEARANDGANGADDYRPKTRPGVYVPTPITVTSTWPNVRPFALTTPSQFRPQPPIALNGKQWATNYNEVRDLGGKASTKRTAKQTEDARFWLITGPQSTDPVARQLVAAKKMSIAESSRFMAVAAVALADAYISVMDAKYHYDFWRPITAIRNGDTDDNPATARDPTWQPLDNTPMHPEYPCAHCISSAALAAVVETMFGTADVPEITMTSATAAGVTHRWTNLRTYADEVANARILAGFHYRFSAQVGQDMGRKIGVYVVRNVIQPTTVSAR